MTFMMHITKIFKPKIINISHITFIYEILHIKYYSVMLVTKPIWCSQNDALVVL